MTIVITTPEARLGVTGLPIKEELRRMRLGLLTPEQIAMRTRRLAECEAIIDRYYAHRDGRSRPQRNGFVYFLHASRANLIKIGWAVDVAVRTEVIQSWEPDRLILLASQPGTRSTEKGLHRRFAAGRRHGEWFAPTTELLAYIAAVKEAA